MLMLLLWFLMAVEAMFVMARREIVKIPDTLFRERSLIFVSGLVSCVGVVVMYTTCIPYSWGLVSVDWNALDCVEPVVGFLVRNHDTQCVSKITLFARNGGP
jgi:hypothetical protein